MEAPSSGNKWIQSPQTEGPIEYNFMPTGTPEDPGPIVELTPWPGILSEHRESESWSMDKSPVNFYVEFSKY